jgi:hypothetical protein
VYDLRVASSERRTAYFERDILCVFFAHLRAHCVYILPIKKIAIINSVYDLRIANSEQRKACGEQRILKGIFFAFSLRTFALIAFTYFP